MADGTEASAVVSDVPAKPGEVGGDGGSEAEAAGGLEDARMELMERCLLCLQQARNDSHTLAALLMVRLGMAREKEDQRLKQA